MTSSKFHITPSLLALMVTTLRVNKTKVESVQLEKTLELIVRVKLLVQFISFSFLS